MRTLDITGLHFKMHACLQALVIGTDIPDISASTLDAAVAALDSHEVVVHR